MTTRKNKILKLEGDSNLSECNEVFSTKKKTDERRPLAGLIGSSPRFKAPLAHPLFGGSRVYHGPLLNVFSFLSCPFLFLLTFIKVSLPRRLLTTHTRHTHTHTHAFVHSSSTTPNSPCTLARVHFPRTLLCIFFFGEIPPPFPSQVLRLPSSTYPKNVCVCLLV